MYEAVVYDGSDSGDKLYDTTRRNRQGDRAAGAHADRCRRQAGGAGVADPLAGHASAISTRASRAASRLPIYSITFELYENGVSRALLLDYGDFVVSGEMTQIEIKDSKPCP